MHSTKYERSLIIVKPDAIQRRLLGEIIHRFERKGLDIVGMKMMELGDVLLDEHYAHHKDKAFFPKLKKYMQSAPVVLMAIAGVDAVATVRLIVGPTKSREASAGTIRGDFAMSVQTNIVHASDTRESAEKEIKRFFDESELCERPRHDLPYIYSPDELE
ncbi:MAG: nucleoside-diphosphate kinase [Patescibacteria group bacterium]